MIPIKENIHGQSWFVDVLISHYGNPLGLWSNAFCSFQQQQQCLNFMIIHQAFTPATSCWLQNKTLKWPQNHWIVQNACITTHLADLNHDAQWDISLVVCISTALNQSTEIMLIQLFLTTEYCCSRCSALLFNLWKCFRNMFYIYSFEQILLHWLNRASL